MLPQAGQPTFFLVSPFILLLFNWLRMILHHIQAKMGAETKQEAYWLLRSGHECGKPVWLTWLRNFKCLMDFLLVSCHPITPEPVCTYIHIIIEEEEEEKQGTGQLHLLMSNHFVPLYIAREKEQINISSFSTSPSKQPLSTRISERKISRKWKPENPKAWKNKTTKNQ